MALKKFFEKTETNWNLLLFDSNDRILKANLSWTW